MKLSTKIFLGVIVILIGVILYGYFRIENLTATVEEQRNTIQVNNQNIEAYKNQVSMIEDSLQDYAVFVQDLQQDIKNEKKKYVLLNQKYTILVNSVNVIDSNANVIVLEDSIIKVLFDGKDGKVSYDGNTKYYVKTKQGTYSIEIKVDSTIIVSEVYIDTLGIIRNEIYADGILFKDAQTIIDSSLFILVKNSTLKKEQESNIFDRIGVFGDITYGGKFTNLDQADNGTLFLGGGAYFTIHENMSISVSKYINNSDWYFTLSYYKSIREIFGGN